MLHEVFEAFSVTVGLEEVADLIVTRIKGLDKVSQQFGEHSVGKPLDRPPRCEGLQSSD